MPAIPADERHPVIGNNERTSATHLRGPAGNRGSSDPHNREVRVVVSPRFIPRHIQRIAIGDRTELTVARVSPREIQVRPKADQPRGADGRRTTCLSPASESCPTRLRRNSSPIYRRTASSARQQFRLPARPPAGALHRHPRRQRWTRPPRYANGTAPPPRARPRPAAAGHGCAPVTARRGKPTSPDEDGTWRHAPRRARPYVNQQKMPQRVRQFVLSAYLGVFPRSPHNDEFSLGTCRRTHHLRAPGRWRQVRMVTQPHNGRLPTPPDSSSHGGNIIDRVADPRPKYQPALAPITSERELRP